MRVNTLLILLLAYIHFYKISEKGIITKECIVTVAHLNFVLNGIYTSVN